MKLKHLLTALPLMAMSVASIAADENVADVRLSAGYHLGKLEIEGGGDTGKGDNNGLNIEALVQTNTPFRFGITLRSGEVSNLELNGVSFSDEPDFDEQTLYIGAKLDNNIVVGLSRVKTELGFLEGDDTRVSFGTERLEDNRRFVASGSFITGDFKGFAFDAESTWMLDSQFGVGIYGNIIMAEIDETDEDVQDIHIGVRGEYRFSM